MIALGSLVGFALVFLLSSWSCSALGCLLLGIGWERARRAGCQVERCLAAIALIVPPLFGAAVAGVLAAHSLAAGWLASGDHCLRHLHHAHLCLRHGGAWARQPWAVGAVTGASLLWVIVIASHACSLFRVLRTLHRLEEGAQESRQEGIPILWIASRVPFCFAVGIGRPRILVSSRLEELLTDAERAAVLSHEAAHAQQGDLWMRPLLGALSLLGAPGLSGIGLSQWDRATERLCDERAAARTGDAAAVASALVKLVRAGSAPLAFATSFVSASGVEERVRALLDGQPLGEAQARRVVRGALWAAGLGLFGLLLFSDAIHHLLETLLGMV